MFLSAACRAACHWWEIHAMLSGHFTGVQD